jgi:hypothetical protein
VAAAAVRAGQHAQRPARRLCPAPVRPDRELFAGYIEAYPTLAAYPGAVAALAKAEARAVMLDEYLTEHGMWTEKGELRNDAIGHLRGFERDATQARAALGLTPDGEAKLMAVRAEAARGAMSAEVIRERAEAARTKRQVRQATS